MHRKGLKLFGSLGPFFIYDFGKEVYNVKQVYDFK